jgi:hypothetical protein
MPRQASGKEVLKHVAQMEAGKFVRRFDVIASAVAVVAAAFVVAVGGITASASMTTLPGNASTVNVASGCSGMTAWHFVLPAGGDSPRPTFVSITAVFKTAGTVTYSGPFTHNDTQTPDDGAGFVTTTADTLLSATAVASRADADDFFVLSSIICSGASPSTISTTVFDAASNAAWAGTEVAPASAYDTSTVTAGATGTVNYTFFSNGTCQGDGTDAGAVAVGGRSSTESTLAASTYSFQARYNGDARHAGSTGPCEPFTVTAPTTGPTETSITTVVFNAATDAALIGGNLVRSGSVYDTSTVTAGATGSVSYKFWTNGDCGVSEHVAGADAGTALALGTHSSAEGPLTTGSYSFEALYTSANTALFTNATGGCEAFSVTARPTGPTETSIATVVFNAATDAALIGGNLVAGRSVYDTSTVTAGATGSVSYRFWTNGDCGVSEHVAGADAGTALALGTHSSAEGPLTAGSYSFEAVYTSDNTALFTGSTGACELFNVVAGGVGGSTATPSPTATPTGGVLAATGGITPVQGLAVFLIAFGLLAMLGGAFAWRRRRT